MTRPTQKQHERAILDIYIGLSGLSGRVEGGPEPPDFLIQDGDRRIGVEVTEYHQPVQSGHRFKRSQVEAEWEALRDAVAGYRESHHGLENLSVILTFSTLGVPRRRQHQAFIEAVHAEIEKVRDRLGRERITIRIGDQHPAILRDYVRMIDVRRVNAYMEWDWNHMMGGVGTSEQELIDLLTAKLRVHRPGGLDQFHLVVAGDGASIGTTIGRLEPDRLNGWSRLNSALDRGSYDVVAILGCGGVCAWRRGGGWSQSRRG